MRSCSHCLPQIQCSDPCRVQEFLSKALDPPSPFAGKNSSINLIMTDNSRESRPSFLALP